MMTTVGGFARRRRLRGDHFIPRLDPVQDFTREILRLPGFVYLGAA
jgi:hypothetical protein